MDYKPTTIEVIAKSFIYSILSIGGMIGTLGLSVFILGGRSKGEGQKIIASNLWEIINTPYFAIFVVGVLVVAVYSAIKGYVPTWAKYTAYTLIGIAFAPITILLLLDMLAIKLGLKDEPDQHKPDITPAQRVQALKVKTRNKSNQSGTH